VKKIVIHKPGSYDRLVIEEHPDPEPGPDEILIAVEAIGDPRFAEITSGVANPQGLALEAEPLPGLGLVGQPLAARLPAVESALLAGLVPVVTPVAVGPLNVNADEAASALAVGLDADRIVFVSDVPGVLVEGAVARALHADRASELLDRGVFEGGIVPKLLAAVRAARLGVRAEIGATEVLA